MLIASLQKVSQFCFIITAILCNSQGIAQVVYSNTSGLITELPGDIPDDVTNVEITNSPLNTLNQDIIANWYRIETLDLNRNQFTVLPDCCAIGSTLKELILIRNLIETVPTSLLDCLVVIAILDLRANFLNYFPDIKDVGNTLESLDLFFMRITHIPTDGFKDVKALRILTLTYNGLTEMPDFLDAANTLQEIILKGNRIRNIPNNTFYGFNSLYTLNIEDNNIQHFPYLCHLQNNSIGIRLCGNSYLTINADYVSCLKNLQNLCLGSNKLNSTENLNLTNSALSLHNLEISYSLIKTLPYLGPLSAVTALNLQNNLLYYLDDDFFFKWHSLEILNLQNNKELFVLPNLDDVKDSLKILDLSGCGFKALNSYNFAILNTLQAIYLSGVSAAFIPTVCPNNPSRMTISVNNVALCSCQNLWIKQAQINGGNVELKQPLACDNLDWKSSDIGDLYKRCTAASFGSNTLYHFKIRKRISDFLCRFPVIPTISNQSMYQCASSCIHTPGCYSFNYRPLTQQFGTNFGDCSLIVPSPEGTVIPSTMQSLGWNFYQFEYHFDN